MPAMPKIVSAMTWAFVGGGAATMGALVQNMPMPPGLGGVTLLSRSDRGLRFVRSRQRFVRRCHGRKKPQSSTTGAVKLERGGEEPFEAALDCSDHALDEARIHLLGAQRAVMLAQDHAERAS